MTNLERSEATPEQRALLYAKRADTENVFDELKNQWGFRGYCSQRAVVTELAARLVRLTYNLWSLFTRLLGLSCGGFPRRPNELRLRTCFMRTCLVQNCLVQTCLQIC